MRMFDYMEDEELASIDFDKFRNSVTLTTEDNPFDPFTQWEDWYRFDVDYGHNTCALIARMYDLVPNTIVDEDDRIEEAINMILQCDYLVAAEGYKLVSDE